MNTACQSTVNPVFAAHLSRKLREATADLHRVFDNLLEIARGDVPDANGYDQLRATRILYDRGFGKVTRNQPHNSAPVSSRPPESEESHNRTNHSSDSPETKAAETSNRPVARLEQKLDHALGPTQAPAQPDDGGDLNEGEKPDRNLARGLPAPSIDTPRYTPDLVREAQYYVLEITNYGDELVSILMNIHEPDPDDTSIRQCHRLTAAQMIFDRVLGPAAELAQPLDHWHDPSLEPNWITKHPAEIDSDVTLEELIEADRSARELIEGMRKEREEFEEREETGPCTECENDYLCEYHAMAEDLSRPEDEIIMTARGMRNLGIFRDRLYFDEHGLLRLHPPNHIDDS